MIPPLYPSSSRGLGGGEYALHGLPSRLALLLQQVDRRRPLQLPLLALHLHTPATTAQQDYSHVAALDNTLNDADDVAAKFEAMGCDVMKLTDETHIRHSIGISRRQKSQVRHLLDGTKALAHTSQSGRL